MMTATVEQEWQQLTDYYNTVQLKLFIIQTVHEFISCRNQLQAQGNCTVQHEKQYIYWRAEDK